MSTKQVTTRQQAVIDGLAAGKEPKAIAKEMGISVNGVYGHMRRLKKAGLISKNGKKRGRPRRATTSSRSTRRNGSRKNGHVPSEAKAISKAVADGRKRIEVIDANIANFEDEKAQIEKAIAGAS